MGREPNMPATYLYARAHMTRARGADRGKPKRYEPSAGCSTPPYLSADSKLRSREFVFIVKHTVRRSPRGRASASACVAVARYRGYARRRAAPRAAAGHRTTDSDTNCFILLRHWAHIARLSCTYVSMMGCVAVRMRDVGPRCSEVGQERMRVVGACCYASQRLRIRRPFGR